MNEGDRIPLVAANWKMHKTVTQTEEFMDDLIPLIVGTRSVHVVVCPPFPALAAAVAGAEDSAIRIFAQNMHHEPEGAFTGEVAPTMLTDLGVRGAILGHSERRDMFGESDRALALKVPAALAAGLTPILCVGETEEEREAEETERKLRHQIQEDLARVNAEQLGDLVIAYEPIWCIGTGRVASPEQAQEAIAFIRALVADRSPEHAAQTRVLYGGSVNADNAAELLRLPDVDGALVGGASLRADSFAAIVAAAG